MKKQIIFRYAVLIIAIFHITQSNSQSWLAVGSGTNGYIISMITDTINNVLYVGGSIPNAGGITTNNIAKWNGTKWDSLGNGCTGVSSLGIYKGMSVQP